MDIFIIDFEYIYRAVFIIAGFTLLYFGSKLITGKKIKYLTTGPFGKTLKRIKLLPDNSLKGYDSERKFEKSYKGLNTEIVKISPYFAKIVGIISLFIGLLMIAWNILKLWI